MGIGYLPQETSIFRNMTVSENIHCILEIFQPEKKARTQRLEQLINDFSISHLRNSPAMILSGGERRRVEIARTLAADPLFILLDEPFAGIDPIAIGDITNIIVRLKHMGIGILITDHNIRETLTVVDRAYIVYDGKILASGSKEEILNNKDVKKFYLGENFN
jgi:lipopolysaccharide export system ATP-binding protein